MYPLTSPLAHSTWSYLCGCLHFPQWERPYNEKSAGIDDGEGVSGVLDEESGVRSSGVRVLGVLLLGVSGVLDLIASIPGIVGFRIGKWSSMVLVIISCSL